MKNMPRKSYSPLAFPIRRVPVSNLCIKLRFEKAARWQAAVHLFHEIPTARFCPSLVSFNSLISCLKEAGQWQLSLWTLLQMVHPTCNLGGKAISAVNQLRVPSIWPDIFTFNATISSCANGAHWQWAIQIFDIMCRSRTTPDTITFNAMISSSEPNAF